MGHWLDILGKAFRPAGTMTGLGLLASVAVAEEPPAAADQLPDRLFASDASVALFGLPRDVLAAALDPIAGNTDIIILSDRDLAGKIITPPALADTFIEVTGLNHANLALNEHRWNKLFKEIQKSILERDGGVSAKSELGCILVPLTYTTSKDFVASFSSIPAHILENVTDNVESWHLAVMAHEAKHCPQSPTLWLDVKKIAQGEIAADQAAVDLFQQFPALYEYGHIDVSYELNLARTVDEVHGVNWGTHTISPGVIFPQAPKTQTYESDEIVTKVESIRHNLFSILGEKIGSKEDSKAFFHTLLPVAKTLIESDADSFKFIPKEEAHKVVQLFESLMNDIDTQTYADFLEKYEKELPQIIHWLKIAQGKTIAQNMNDPDTYRLLYSVTQERLAQPDTGEFEKRFLERYQKALHTFIPSLVPRPASAPAALAPL